LGEGFFKAEARGRRETKTCLMKKKNIGRPSPHFLRLRVKD
jgi:hypothetical protein